jgi:xanthine dehydrogenase accessory factor
VQAILRRTIELLQAGQDAAWATVVANSGSTPRKAGSRMVVEAGGGLHGSVGGGRLEAETLELARRELARRGRGVLRFELTSADARESDMVCGGRATVLVESLTPEDLPFLQRAQELLARGREAWLLTWVSERAGGFGQAHLLAEAGGPVAGGLPDRLAALAEPAAAAPTALRELEPGQGWLLTERLEPREWLYLFGAGHVGEEVAWQAARLGFAVAVCDDRAEFANRRRFPMAEEVWAGPWEELLDSRRLGPRDYAVIMTRGHQHDLEVLARVLEHRPDYVGMIGSRRKRAVIYQELERRGVAAERLAEVRAPIGVKLPAETPAEIAVSIAAQLIEERARARSAAAAGPELAPAGARGRCCGS